MRLLLFILSFINPKNWTLLLYLFLNVGVMFLFEYIMVKDFIGILPIIYGCSLFLVTLPFGETILRLKTKASPIKGLGNTRIINLFNEVYSLAIKKSKIRLSRHVKLYFINDNSINASALGFRTLIINTGILNCSDNQIKAILFHEFSHLIEQDSIHNVIFKLGNIVLLFFYLVLRTILFLIAYCFTGVIFLILEKNEDDYNPSKKVNTFFNKTVDKAYNLWNLFGQVICMHTLRLGEYIADDFAKKCGYGKELSDILMLGKSKEFLGANELLLTHPPVEKRIERLNA